MYNFFNTQRFIHMEQYAIINNKVKNSNTSHNQLPHLQGFFVLVFLYQSHNKLPLKLKPLSKEARTMAKSFPPMTQESILQFMNILDIINSKVRKTGIILTCSPHWLQ